MKIAVINSPFSSHIGRMEFVFTALRDKGYEVELWGSGATETIASRNALTFRPIDLQTDYVRLMQQKLKPYEYYNEIFFPMAKEQLGTVLEYCDKYAPDVMEVNTRVFSGTIASMITGIPLVTHCSSGNSFAQIPEDLYGFCVKGNESPRQKSIMLNLSREFFERTDGWFNENISKPFQLGTVKNAVGLCSNDYSMAQSIRELSKTRIADLENVYLTGPIMSEEHSDVDFAQFQPYCYVSLGTCPWFKAEILERYQALIQYVPRDYKIVIGLGHLLDKEALGIDDPRVVVFEQAPQIEAIKHSEFVICHGGCQTVHEALYFGKPMIGIPHYAEISEMVNSVEINNAGIKVAPAQLSEKTIGEAVTRVMSDEIVGNADRLSRLLRKADGFESSVRLFETVNENLSLRK